MITAEAVGLALKIAKGVIKLTHRVDLVLAEKEAVQAPMALPAPDLALGPSHAQMRRGLQALLDRPVGSEDDALGSDRQTIEQLLANDPGAADMEPFVARYLPDLAVGRVLDLNGEFVAALRQARPDWAADPDVIAAAFHVGAGVDFRNKSYTWRLALTVVDVLAEFGAENTALFIRDERVQGIVGVVLQRFADADVQTTDTTADLLRAVLKATLNGVVDARAQVGFDNEWISALLDAVALARSKAADPDNFVMGLVRGTGYPLLVGAAMETAAGKLAADQASGFKQTAATFLADVAAIVEAKPSFQDFFNDHWGDLLRAGLKSVERHGPQLLADENPLLGKVLSALAGDLAKRPNNKFLTREALEGLVDAAVGTVANNPDLVEELLGDEWVSALVKSVAGTLSQSGVRAAFTRAGLERMAKDVLRTFGDHPELIVDRPGLAQELLGDVLKSLSTVDSFNPESLATATVAASLETISKHPELLNFDYSKVVAGLAGKAATLVKEKKLTGVQAQDLMQAAIAALVENPALLTDMQTKLVDTVVGAVTSLAEGSKGKLIAGATLVDVVRQVLGALAVSGRAALANHPLAEFGDTLAQLLEAGLTRAEVEIGNRIGSSALPRVFGQLVVAWAQGKIATVDPDNANFKRLFAELADAAQAGVA